MLRKISCGRCFWWGPERCECDLWVVCFPLPCCPVLDSKMTPPSGPASATPTKLTANLSNPVRLVAPWQHMTEWFCVSRFAPPFPLPPPMAAASLRFCLSSCSACFFIPPVARSVIFPVCFSYHASLLRRHIVRLSRFVGGGIERLEA
jgi:hypothetical protein